MCVCPNGAHMIWECPIYRFIIPHNKSNNSYKEIFLDVTKSITPFPKTMKYLGEALDEATRFLVASHLSDQRDFKEILEQFTKIAEKGRPQVMFLDGSHVYNRAFNKVFFSR